MPVGLMLITPLIFNITKHIDVYYNCIIATTNFSSKRLRKVVCSIYS
jgi:hypothetical protein